MARSFHGARALLLVVVALGGLACGRRTLISADADGVDESIDASLPLEACGRGRKPCDPEDLGGHTCEALGLAGGELACDPDTCNFDITGCDGIEGAPTGSAGRAAGDGGTPPLFGGSNTAGAPSTFGGLFGGGGGRGGAGRGGGAAGQAGFLGGGFFGGGNTDGGFFGGGFFGGGNQDGGTPNNGPE